ncbi:FecCD family ABC transporter permease [Corynebacterium hindlerae]|uniref:FecCD family ABC transporter permease n=1 Tax=Corynebacterium hindlerae TaxID=699041 RepID=UPI0031B6C1A2
MLRESCVPVKAIVSGLTLLAVVTFVFSLTLGSVHYAPAEVIEVLRNRLTGSPVNDPAVDAVVWQLRAPRGLLALIVGAGLALAGVLMQTLVRNPLADPYLLGVSSGASVGATAVITFGVFSGIYALAIGALLGAVVATACVFFVAMIQGGLTPLRLILAGVVLSSAFSAMASFLVFKSSDARAAQSVMFWMLGSVSGAQWNKLLLPLVMIIAGSILAVVISRPLDAMVAGPDTAASLGVRVELLRNVLFLAQAALVGIMVAVAGGIGFVGLIIPHLARMLVGSIHRRVIPVAMTLGAVFLLWVDIIARVVVAPQEVPLGVVTGLIGAPLFLFIMGRGTYRFGGQA